MTPEALTRAARQLALPQIGLDGQTSIAAATVALVSAEDGTGDRKGDDLACEVAARALSAAGVGTLRIVRRGGAWDAIVERALRASNPAVVVENRPWPAAADSVVGSDVAGTGAAWLAALDGVAVVVRAGFDDDPMLRAAVRGGVPAVVMRGRADRVDVVSFRRHGPCPHVSLHVPEVSAAPSRGGAAAVIAGEIAAAEALVLLAGAALGGARARHLSVPLSSTGAPPASVDIPWAPECFLCGGSSTEMSFA